MHKVCLIGKPNVGKSSLFNVLLGRRRSIVLDLPGTTLDCIHENVLWAAASVSDTQGIFTETDIPKVLNLVRDQDAFLFIVDGRSEPTPFDKDLAQAIMSLKKPILLCLNKTENGAPFWEDWMAFGFDEHVQVSASHKKNVQDIKDWVRNLSDADNAPVKNTIAFTAALLGRPNTGKSTLMNRLCDKEVSRVSPIPLTTRDYINYTLETKDGAIQILDTAGMRRPRSKKEKLESFSINASLKAVEESDIILLCLACHEDISDQDMRLLSLVERSGKPVLVLLNFWDTLKKQQQKDFLEDSEFRHYLKKFITLPISGATGFQVDKILPQAARIVKKSQTRVTTSDLNRVVEKLVVRNPPPSAGNGNFNILYASQVKTTPPTFVFFMNRKGALPKSYEQYLINGLKSHLNLKGQTVRLHFRSR